MIFFALPTACKVGSQQEQMNLFCRILRGCISEGSRTQKGRERYWKRRDQLKQTEQFRPRASPQPRVIKFLTLLIRASCPGKISPKDSLDSKATDSGPVGWHVGLNTDRVAISNNLLPELPVPTTAASSTEPRNFPRLHQPSHPPPSSFQETGQCSRKTKCPQRNAHICSPSIAYRKASPAHPELTAELSQESGSRTGAWSHTTQMNPKSSETNRKLKTLWRSRGLLQWPTEIFNWASTVILKIKKFT